MQDQVFSKIIKEMGKVSDIADKMMEDDSTFHRQIVAGKILGCVSKLHADLIQVQSLCYEKNDVIDKLEKELGNLNEWNSEKERYGMVSVSLSNVYALKKSKSDLEAPHYICPVCYQHQRKSILQRGAIDGVRKFFCPECDFVSFDEANGVNFFEDLNKYYNKED